MNEQRGHSWLPIEGQVGNEYELGEPLRRTLLMGGWASHSSPTEVSAYRGDPTEQFVGHMGYSGFRGAAVPPNPMQVATLNYDSARPTQWSNEVITQIGYRRPPAQTQALDMANQYMREVLRDRPHIYKAYLRLNGDQRIAVSQLLNERDGVFDPKWLTWLIMHPESIPVAAEEPQHFFNADQRPQFYREHLMPAHRKELITYDEKPADYNWGSNPATGGGSDEGDIPPPKGLSYGVPPNATDPAKGDYAWSVGGAGPQAKAFATVASAVLLAAMAAAI